MAEANDRPSGVPRRLLLGVATTFTLLVASQLHGYSLPVWHALLDGSPADEVLLGQARPVRSDEGF